MMVMTAKIDKKKIFAIAAAVIGLIAALFLLFGGKKESISTAAPSVATNDARIKFLTDFGWDVTTSPVESGQVRIPADQEKVFQRYNDLQKSQGYDLTSYGGKLVMRYVYQIENYPNATEPVYATLLIYKNQVIGGDITNTSARGNIQGFKKAASQQEPDVNVPSAEKTD